MENFNSIQSNDIMSEFSFRDHKSPENYRLNQKALLLAALSLAYSKAWSRFLTFVTQGGTTPWKPLANT